MVFLFSAIALFILLIACVNFIHLMTARSSVRGKEISIRKVVGADRNNLIWQFMGETFLISLMALSGSVVLIRFLLPRFNLLVGENLTLDLFKGELLLGILVIFIVTGFFAGAYPSFHLSSLYLMKR
jgi:putative ABC transport system permease protein